MRSGDQATILVVDDDPATRTLVSRQLEKQDHHAIAVKSGEDALSVMHEQSVDVLLSDWMMPGMAGIELCRIVKNDPELSSIYVILLTSLNAPLDIATGLDAGADDYLAKPFRSVELAARIRSGLRIIRLQRDLSQRNLELTELASTDPLTGIRNRYALECALSAAIEQHRRWSKPLSVILFDIDHFKRVNDQLGHPAGDDLLRALSEAVRAQVRRSDIFGRLGGDEFLLILPETRQESAVECAERIRVAALSLSTEINFLSDDSPITLSAGVVTWIPQSNSYGVSAAELIKWTDEALYTSKNRGRNCVTGVSVSPEKSEKAGWQDFRPASCPSPHNTETDELPDNGREQRQDTLDEFNAGGS